MCSSAKSENVSHRVYVFECEARECQSRVGLWAQPRNSLLLYLWLCLEIVFESIYSWCYEMSNAKHYYVRCDGRENVPKLRSLPRDICRNIVRCAGLLICVLCVLVFESDKNETVLHSNTTYPPYQQKVRLSTSLEDHDTWNRIRTHNKSTC